MLASHVIIIGIDGLRPDQVTPELMPNLSALKARGVSSKHHRTVFPSETRGALTALANGARPVSTGILGNEFYGRGSDPALVRTDTIHDWYRNDGLYAGGMVTTVSLGETLAKAGMALAVVTSSGQGSFTALSWKGDEWGNVGFNVRHPQISYPHDLAYQVERAHNVPAGGFDRGCEAKAIDVFTKTVWDEVRPEASIIWLTEVDSASHRYGLGAEGQIETLRSCDAAIGQLVEWRDGLEDAEDVVILVTSDHGHITTTENIDVAQVLRDAGFKADKNFETGADVLVRRGRCPGLWLNRPDEGLRRALAETLAAQSFTQGLFTRDGQGKAGEGALEGTLAISLSGANHFRAPDLYLEMAAGNAPNAHGVAGTGLFDGGNYGTKVGGSTHGGMHWSELTAVLVGDGGCLKRGGAVIDTRTGIQDLAPTVLALLGVTPPLTMTGRPLLDLVDAEPVQPVRTEVTETRLGDLVSKVTTSEVAGRPYLDHSGEGPQA